MGNPLLDNRGQATLEAAFAIPVLFLLLLLLIQPGIVLYDRLVMANAAAEACRLLATSGDAIGATQGNCEAFVRHRLAAIPQHDCFHVHGSACSYGIDFEGDETSETVTVKITNELRPLPLFDTTSTLLGLTNGSGNLEITESATCATQPGWVASTEQGLAPSTWPGAWCE